MNYEKACKNTIDDLCQHKVTIVVVVVLLLNRKNLLKIVKPCEFKISI